MKILNAYCGLGGNRILWGDEHAITAIDIDPTIINYYKYKYPKDTVIVGDAHKYILEHYTEFDFIWASPPCPENSRAKFWRNDEIVTYPELSLYEEILLLKHRFAGCFVVENVIPYYEALIRPKITIGRHNFWANFFIGKLANYRTKNLGINDFTNTRILKELYDIKNIVDFEFQQRKATILRNMIDPDIGLHILNSSFKYGLFNTKDIK